MEFIRAVLLSLAGLCFITLAASECNLDILTPDSLLVSFGAEQFTSPTSPILQINRDESVELYCPQGFEGYNIPDEKKTIKLECQWSQWSGREFFYYYPNRNHYIDVRTISCKKHQLYQSQTKLPDCEQYMTFVVVGSIKRAAICYDMVGRELKYVSYMAYPPTITTIEQMEQTQSGELAPLGLDFKITCTTRSLSPVSADDVKNALRRDYKHQELFKEDIFEYGSLIQESSLVELGSDEDMLNIVWLRTLQTGNWWQFLKALRAASVDNKLEVRVGVSDVVKLPPLNQYNETTPLTIEVGDRLISVPAYIWMHLRTQPADNKSEEFVVIGHNSPLSKSEDLDNFCSSMCEEVAWLRNSLFAKLHHYALFGRMQCCRVDQVADKLQNFPKTRETATATFTMEPATELEMDSSYQLE